MYNNKVSCGSGGTGRRARLRGVWFYRTGSIPVSRTNKKRRVLVALLFLLSRSGCTRFALYAKYKIKPKVSNFTLKHNHRRANRVHIPPSAVFCAVRRYTKALDKKRHVIRILNPAQQIPVSAVARPCGESFLLMCKLHYGISSLYLFFHFFILFSLQILKIYAIIYTKYFIKDPLCIKEQNSVVIQPPFLWRR